MRQERSACLLLLLAVAPAGILVAQSDVEQRQVAPFSKLRVQNGIDVHLAQAEEHAVRIEVDGVDLGDVVTEVVDEELRISRSGWTGIGFLSDKEVDVYVDFVRLTEVDVSGGSDLEGRSAIELDELSVRASGGSDVRLAAVDVPQLEFALSGGSDLNVEGTTTSLGIEASGGSDVSARQLQAQQAVVRLSGGSDASVQVRERIDVDASGGSDVDVHGDPADRSVDADRSSDVTWK